METRKALSLASTDAKVKLNEVYVVLNVQIKQILP